MPFAASNGVDQPPPSFWDTQMLTSGLDSNVPANQAATKPFLVSAMVDAWLMALGDWSKINLSLRTAGCRILSGRLD
jgi:hypothetical protein